MPSSDNHGSSVPFPTLRRPVLSMRSDTVQSEMSKESSIQDLDLFQRNVSTRFRALSEFDPKEFLSVSWIRELLNAYDSCQVDFRAILTKNKALLAKPPAEKLLSDFFDKSVKAMDIFNATRDGLETIRQWQKHLEIIVCALDSNHRVIGEGQTRRARKSLMDLSLVMLEDQNTGSIFSQRNRSFGRKGKDHQRRNSGHSRSLSWSVSHTWSAAKQLQSIANNLTPPRANGISATNGLATLIFSMSFLLLFVLWALVAAIPCQDRNVIVLTIPRNFPWSVPFSTLYSRIMDESKKKDRRNSSGLLKEIYQIEKCVNQITDVVDAAQFPMSEEMKEEMRESVQELASVCEVCKTGLDPLERHLREVFRGIMSCRNEGMEFLGKATE